MLLARFAGEDSGPIYVLIDDATIERCEQLKSSCPYGAWLLVGEVYATYISHSTVADADLLELLRNEDVQLVRVDDRLLQAISFRFQLPLYVSVNELGYELILFDRDIVQVWSRPMVWQPVSELNRIYGGDWYLCFGLVSTHALICAIQIDWLELPRVSPDSVLTVEIPRILVGYASCCLIPELATEYRAFAREMKSDLAPVVVRQLRPDQISSSVYPGRAYLTVRVDEHGNPEPVELAIKLPPEIHGVPVLHLTSRDEHGLLNMLWQAYLSHQGVEVVL